MHNHSFTCSLHCYNVTVALIIISNYSDFLSHLLADGDVIAVCCVFLFIYVSAGAPDDPVFALFSLHRCRSWLPVFWLLVSIFTSSHFSSLITPPLYLISPFKHLKNISLSLRLGLILSFLTKHTVRDGSGYPETSHIYVAIDLDCWGSSHDAPLLPLLSLLSMNI